MGLDNKHYLIVGSGLIGRLLAWRLLGLGHTVDIVSRDDKLGSDSAGFVAAAMISPATEAISSEAIVKEVGLKSLALWPQWLAELPETIFYQDKGTLVVTHSGDQAEMTRFKRRADYMLEDSDFDVLDQSQLADKEAQLAERFDQALFFADESCLDNRHLYRVLADVLTQSERCNWQQSDDVEQLTPAVIESLTQQHFNRSFSAYDSVIDCRGNGAKKDVEGLRSVRGEVIRVHAPDVNFKHAIRLIHPRYPFYLAPRPNNEYVLGATVVESDDMSPVSVRSGLELMSALYSLHTGFAEARILEMAVHCRPAMKDNMPTVQRTDWGFHLNGFYRHGYLFAPAIIDDFLTILGEQQAQLSFGEFYNV